MIKDENFQRINLYREEFTVPKKGEARLIKQGKEIRDIKDVMAASQEKKHNLPENWVKESTSLTLKLHTEGSIPQERDVLAGKMRKLIANPDEVSAILEVHYYRNLITGEIVLERDILGIKNKMNIKKK